MGLSRSTLCCPRKFSPCQVQICFHLWDSEGNNYIELPLKQHLGQFYERQYLPWLPNQDSWWLHCWRWVSFRNTRQRAQLYLDDNLILGGMVAIDDAISALKSKGLQDCFSCKIKFSNDKKRAWIGQPHLMKIWKSNLVSTCRMFRITRLQVHLSFWLWGLWSIVRRRSIGRRWWIRSLKMFPA